MSLFKRELHPNLCQKYAKAEAKPRIGRGFSQIPVEQELGVNRVQNHSIHKISQLLSLAEAR